MAVKALALKSEETATNGNGWSLKSLYELVREIDKRQSGDLEAADKRYEERYIGQLREVKTALDNQAKAVDKAEQAADKRFDEFKREMSEKLTDLIKARDTGIGHGVGVREVVAYVISAVVIGAALWPKIHP